MPPRMKKLIGLFVLPAGLVLYAGAAVTLADQMPKFWLAQLCYFVVAGVGWALPAIPFIRWMEKEPRKKGFE